MGFNSKIVVGDGNKQEVMSNTSNEESIVNSLSIYNSTDSASTVTITINDVDISVVTITSGETYRMPDKINVSAESKMEVTADTGVTVAVSFVRQPVDISSAITVAQGFVALAADEVNKAKAEADRAKDEADKSAANFKGVWADLTGELAIPSSVSHGGFIWILNASVDDITEVEPTNDSTDWTKVAGGFNYISDANPEITTNPSEVPSTWINSATGEMFVCIDATEDANIWKGQAGGYVAPAGINTPSITDPADEAADAGKNPTLTASEYDPFEQSEDHKSTTWQVADSDAFTTIISESVDNETNLTSWKVADDLTESTEYWLRVKYKSDSYESGWSDVVHITTKDTFQTIVGLEWNEADDTYTRIDAAEGVDLGTGDADCMVVQKQMKRCVLNADGTVNYYLDPTDSTKKEDGSDAVLDGSDGNVMVEIPKFWFKYTKDGDIHRYRMSDVEDDGDFTDVHPMFDRGGTIVDYRYVSAYQASVVTIDGTDYLMSVSDVCLTADKTRDEFRTLAANNGDHWSQLDWYSNLGLQHLYLIEYGTFDSQTAIGMGRTQLSDGAWECGSYWATNGKSNGAGNATYNYEYDGDADDAEAEEACMSYRGVENWYGNVYTFIDGINVLGDYQWWASNVAADYADDTDTNYTKIYDDASGHAQGYSDALVSTGNAILGLNSDGSDSTYVPDTQYLDYDGNRVVRFGQYANAGLGAGAFALAASYGSSDSAAGVGAALSR